jgi:hypothetical protein
MDSAFKKAGRQQWISCSMCDARYVVNKRKKILILVNDSHSEQRLQLEVSGCIP